MKMKLRIKYEKFDKKHKNFEIFESKFTLWKLVQNKNRLFQHG